METALQHDHTEGGAGHSTEDNLLNAEASNLLPLTWLLRIYSLIRTEQSLGNSNQPQRKSSNEMNMDGDQIALSAQSTVDT